MTHERDKIYAYTKNKEIIAIFDKDGQSLSPAESKNMMCNPRIHIETNGASTFSFEILTASEKWQQIKNPETRYYVNGRWYNVLSENSYKYEGVGSVQKVLVTAQEEWYLLSTKYKCAYNCGLLVYAKATFTGWSGTNAVFRVNSSGCSNPGNTISSEMAWHQVRLWQPKDKKGNSLTYTVLKTKEYAPTNWEDAPATLAMSLISVSGNSATLYMTARASQEIQQHYDYQQGGTYQVESRPYPPTIKEVWINTTLTTDIKNGNQTTRRIVTSNKKTTYSYNSSTGKFSINYRLQQGEEANYVIALYDYYDMGELKTGATCTFSWGAEVVDEHTFLILPKADTKYKLTIDGVEYEDSQVRDSRGVIMPRGSGGYAMWAALKSTSWKLGICDVIAKGFNNEIDFGCFNVESDMKDTLYNIQCIAELYGGILDWDSENKVLNYRAENDEDYNSYNDGFNDWTGYEFREGKNIKDQPEITVDNNIITKAYILGYGNLNIKKVNGGKSYVTDFSYTNDVYEGYLEQPLIYDTNDEGGQIQLLYWGQKEIKKKSRPRQTIKYNCIDIRTVENMEHEVFDINDVCRAYYRDTETGEEKYELKRIISWEYNPFAYWDSTVELGDKTANEVELFKLIYNSAVENAPKTNASGKISSDEIVMEIDISELGLEDYDFDYDWEDYEYPNTPIPSYYPGGGYGYGNSLTDYISLIARKTTDNSDAIAGLTLEATELYAQAELFTTYQKRTDDLISDTYSGLRLYADEMGSELEALVQGNYEMTQEAIDRARQEAKDEYIAIRTETQAGFQAQQTQNQAFARQFAQYDGQLVNFNQQLQATVNSVAQCVTYADAQRSYAALTADYNARIKDLEGNITNIVSRSGFVSESNMNQAMAKQYATFTQEINGVKSTAEAAVTTAASANKAVVDIKASVGSLESVVHSSQYGTSITSTSGDNYARINVSSSNISMNAPNNISLSSSGRIQISGTNGVVIGNANQSLTIKGQTVGWVSGWLNNFSSADGRKQVRLLGYTL